LVADRPGAEDRAGGAIGLASDPLPPAQPRGRVRPAVLGAPSGVAFTNREVIGGAGINNEVGFDYRIRRSQATADRRKVTRALARVAQPAISVGGALLATSPASQTVRRVR
jgi:hypothetical protein